MKPAKAGAEAEVPLTRIGFPLSQVRYLWDCAETSGYPYKKRRW